MELQEMFVTLGLKAGEFNQGLDDAAKKAQSFGDRVKGGLGSAVQSAGLAVTAGLAAAGGAIVALGASSVGVATDFQSAMAIMSTAVDPVSLGVESTAEAMAILSDASLAVGGDTALVGVSASTSAEAMTGLYKAGLTTGEIFGDLNGYLAGTAELGGALRASIDLAAASELDMVQASDLAAITLATFGGELTTTEERAAFVESAMNNFVQTADASVASVGDLQAAFVNVGPTASALGMGVEDVNTALGLLSTRGITGSEAGTALKSMLTNLMRTTPDVTGTLEDLNVSLYDAQGVMYSLPEIIGQLEAGMAGMTEEQRNQTVTTLAGTYGMNAMNTLLGEGAAGWAAMEAAVGSAATMQETAAARTNTLAGAQEALGGVWESFQITVGTALIPVLTSLADIGASLIEKYGPALTAAFEAFGAGISRIIEVVQGGQLGELFTVFEDGSSVLGGIFETFGMGEEKANALAAGISNLVENIRVVTDPIIAAVANFVSLKDVLIALGILVAAVLIPIIISLVTTMAPILLTVAAVIAVVALLRNAWEKDWGGIQEKTTAVINFIKALIGGALKAIQGFWNDHGAAITAAATAAWDAIQAGIQAVITIIQTIVGGALKAIQGFWNDHGVAIADAADKAWGLISGYIDGALETIKKVFEAFRLLFEGDWEGLGQKLGEIWETAWNTIITFISGLWNLMSPVLVDVWNSIKNWFTDRVGDAIQIGKNIVQGLIDGVKAMGGALTGALGDIVNGAINSIKALLGISSPSQLFHDIGVNMGEGLVEGIDSTTDDVTAAVEGLLVGIQEIPDAMAQMFEAISGPLGMAGTIGGIAGGFARRFEQTVTGPMRDQLDTLGDTVEKARPIFDNVFKDWGWKMGGTDEAGTLDQLMKLRSRLMGRIQSMPAAASLYEQQSLATVNAAVNAYMERNDLNQEYIRQQERLLALEKARDSMDFLKSQMDLLQLVATNKDLLGADVLAGLEFGVGADPGALMDAAVGIWERLVQNASYELNAGGDAPFLNAATPGSDRGTTYNVQNQTINGGQNFYLYDAEESELERLGVLAR